MEIKNKTWVEGGDAVYGDNPFKEALYALEDELITLDSKDGKFIPQDRMLKVMIAYEKFLKDYFSQQKQEMVEEIKEYWIQKHQDDLRLQEVLAILKQNLTK